MTSCGAELAEDAVVPETLALLMQHVAENMGAHARWVGTATSEALAEHRALLRVADDYRRIAAAARTAAATMRGLRDLKAVEHDPATFDGAAFARWSSEKVRLQTALARLLLEHAERSRPAS